LFTDGVVSTAMNLRTLEAQTPLLLDDLGLTERHRSGYPARYNEPMSGRDEVMRTSPGVKLTYDDFLLFPDDGKRHELIDGEHYVTPSPNRKHQAIVWNLAGMIAPYLESHSVGRAFVAPFDVIFSEFDVVEPDLLFISAARQADILTTKHVRGAPNLVVEIASRSTRSRDETLKRKLYERFGVEEYWVMEPDTDTVVVYKHDGESYQRDAELTGARGDTLTTSLLPGLQLPLDRIFRD
jgi:Uma2 family endonuclease